MSIGSGSMETAGQTPDSKSKESLSSKNMERDGNNSNTARQAWLFSTGDDDGSVGNENGDGGHQLEAEDLTPRQREVFDLYHREKNTTKVAKILGVTRKTVTQHLVMIRDKRAMSDIRNLLDDYEAPAENAVTAARLLDILKEQDYRCALSGRKLEPDKAALDHKLPRSSGGEHSMENVWFLHRDVNRAKGTQTVEEFVRMCRQVCQYSEEPSSGSSP